MTSLVLYVGIAMTFLTVWGVIMVGSFLLGGETDDSPTEDPGHLNAESDQLAHT